MKLTTYLALVGIIQCRAGHSLHSSSFVRHLPICVFYNNDTKQRLGSWIIVHATGVCEDSKQDLHEYQDGSLVERPVVDAA